MFALDDIDEEQQINFKDTNGAMERLSALRQSEIGPYEGEQIVPKTVWKVRTFAQGIIYRSVELATAASSTWNNGNHLAAILLARSIFEMGATTFDFSHRLKNAVDNSDFPAIDNIVMSHTFAGTFFEDDEELEKLPRIYSLIDRLDKHLFKDKKKKSARGCYDILSEYVHPNWTGTVGFFGQLHPKEFSQSFAPHHFDVKRISAHVSSGMIGIKIVESSLEDIEECVPEIWKLSDEHSKNNSG